MIRRSWSRSSFPGERARGNGRTYAILGALLGRVHARGRGGDGLPLGGGWHHLTLSGTAADEIRVARALLAKLKSTANLADRSGIAFLDEALEAAATTTGLPESFVHPDFVPVNAISGAEVDTGGPGLTILDWTNSGRGPRVWSLGFVLWAAGARDPRLVDAFISSYRRHVTLTDAELAALPVAIAARPLTMCIWSLAVGRLEPARAVTTFGPLPSRPVRSPPGPTGRYKRPSAHASQAGTTSQRRSTLPVTGRGTI